MQKNALLTSEQRFAGALFNKQFEDAGSPFGRNVRIQITVFAPFHLHTLSGCYKFSSQNVPVPRLLSSPSNNDGSHLKCWYMSACPVTTVTGGQTNCSNLVSCKYPFVNRRQSSLKTLVMKVEQIYTEGNCNARLIMLRITERPPFFDPLREVQPYIDRAVKDNARIKYVFETHFRRFCSGHLDLHKKSGATIVGRVQHPATKLWWRTTGRYSGLVIIRSWPFIPRAYHGKHDLFGMVDENNKEHGIISGDTLFIGDVAARPGAACGSWTYRR